MKISILNIISSVLLVIGIIGGIMVSYDMEISWTLFPGDSALIFFPIIFFVSLLFSILSFRKRCTGFSIILLILNSLLFLYAIGMSGFIYALGSGWNH